MDEFTLLGIVGEKLSLYKPTYVKADAASREELEIYSNRRHEEADLEQCIF
jgi:hypothetical protein